MYVDIKIQSYIKMFKNMFNKYHINIKSKCCFTTILVSYAIVEGYDRKWKFFSKYIINGNNYVLIVCIVHHSPVHVFIITYDILYTI